MKRKMQKIFITFTILFTFLLGATLLYANDMACCVADCHDSGCCACYGAFCECHLKHFGCGCACSDPQAGYFFSESCNNFGD